MVVMRGAKIPAPMTRMMILIRCSHTNQRDIRSGQSTYALADISSCCLPLHPQPHPSNPKSKNPEHPATVKSEALSSTTVEPLALPWTEDAAG